MGHRFEAGMRRKQWESTALLAVATLTAVAGALCARTPWASASDRLQMLGARKSSAKIRSATTVPDTIKLGPSLDPKKLVAATRTAALHDASRLRVKLGIPVCPSGSPLSTKVVQCLVTLGTTSVAYLVKPDGVGSFEAEPTFPVVGTRSIEAAAEAAIGVAARATCGQAPFQVLPPNSKVACTVSSGGRNRTVIVRVTDQHGSLQADKPSE